LSIVAGADELRILGGGLTSATGAIFLTALDPEGAVVVEAGASVTSDFRVDVVTSRLLVNGTITAVGPGGMVAVQNLADSPTLHVVGVGTISAPGGIFFTAVDDHFPFLIFNSKGQTLSLLDGNVSMIACGGMVRITQGSTIVTNENVTVKARVLVNGDSIQVEPDNALTFNVCPTGSANSAKTGGPLIINGFVVPGNNEPFTMFIMPISVGAAISPPTSG